MARKSGLLRFVLNTIFICELQLLFIEFTNCSVIRTERYNSTVTSTFKNQTLQELDLGQLSNAALQHKNHVSREDNTYGDEVRKTSLGPNETDEAAKLKAMMEPNEEDAEKNDTVSLLAQDVVSDGFPEGQVTIKDIEKIRDSTTILEKMDIKTIIQQTSVESTTEEKNDYTMEYENEDVETTGEETESAEDADELDSMMVPNDDEDVDETNTPLARSGVYEGNKPPIDNQCPPGEKRFNGKCAKPV